MSHKCNKCSQTVLWPRKCPSPNLILHFHMQEYSLSSINTCSTYLLFFFFPLSLFFSNKKWLNLASLLLDVWMNTIIPGLHYPSYFDWEARDNLCLLRVSFYICCILLM